MDFPLTSFLNVRFHSCLFFFSVIFWHSLIFLILLFLVRSSVTLMFGMSFNFTWFWSICVFILSFAMVISIVLYFFLPCFYFVNVPMLCVFMIYTFIPRNDDIILVISSFSSQCNLSCVSFTICLYHSVNDHILWCRLDFSILSFLYFHWSPWFVCLLHVHS